MDNTKYWNEPNLAPTDVTRPHYVPKMYLRAFSRPDGQIRVKDISTDREYTTGLKNTAVERHFYDIQLDGQVMSTEAWLSQIEGNAAPILSRLIDDPDSIMGLSEHDEVTFARFIIALLFRTPAFANQMDNTLAPFRAQMKDGIKETLFHQLPEREAQSTWDEWENNPDNSGMGQLEPEPPAETITFMLGEVKGFANLMIAMPWRIGRIPDSMQLYTSDNPVSRYDSPVRLWWDRGLMSFTYYLPLNPQTLLLIERVKPDTDRSPRGARRRLDFSCWETSVARHVSTLRASRFLYGDGVTVPRNCAVECLSRIGQFNLNYAIRYQGLSPHPAGGLIESSDTPTLSLPRSRLRAPRMTGAGRVDNLNSAMSTIPSSQQK